MRKLSSGRRMGAALAFLVAALALPAPPADAILGEWKRHPQVSVRLVTPYAVAAPGEFLCGLELSLAPGWHSYWKHSGDAGFAPRLDLAATPALGEVEMLFPAPRRFELSGGILAYGYEKEVLYPVRAQLGATAGAELPLRAEFDFLVCSEECVPYRVQLALAQPIASTSQPDPLGRELLDRALAAVPRPASAVSGLKLEVFFGNKGLQGRRLNLRFSAPEIDLSQADLFLDRHSLLDFRQPLAHTTPQVAAFRVPFELREKRGPKREERWIEWTLTGLTADGQALALAGRSSIPLRTSFPLSVTVSLGVALLLGLALAIALRRRRAKAQSTITSQ